MRKNIQRKFWRVSFWWHNQTWSKKLYSWKIWFALCRFSLPTFLKRWFSKWFWRYQRYTIFDICEIVEKHKPKYLLLENVANLVSHDNGNTYKVIAKNLDKLGYIFPETPLIISPDSFGIPILRPRVYIPCVRKEFAKGKENLIKNFKEKIEEQFIKTTLTIDKIIDPKLKTVSALTKKKF